MRRETLYTIALTTLLLAFAGCRSSTSEAKRRQTATVVSGQDRAILHYWDRFNFADKSLINTPETAEQMFADFLIALSREDNDKRTAAVDTLMSRSMRGSKPMFSYFAELAEKYLYDPNSPYRNEEMYIAFLTYIVNAEDAEPMLKVRPEHQLMMAKKNRQNAIATDFVYTLRDGRQSRLSSIESQYTLLFFNDPDCSDCKRVKEILTTNSLFSQNEKLKILSVYPDEDLSVWSKAIYPAHWIDARCREIRTKEIYDLKALPTLYLLDRDKRVILKDAPAELIADWLAANRN